ncbi:MAG: MarR family transcriptional regulator [Acidimicrobiales bacterium]
MSRNQSSDANELLRRLRGEMGSLRRITGSQRLDRLIAVRSGVAIGNAAVAVLGKVIDDGPMRMSDLADAVRTHPAALTRQVQALEAEGYVERSTDPQDGRASVVSVTAAGRNAHRRIEAANDELMAEQLDSWSPEELKLLVEQLDRLVSDLRAVPASRRQKNTSDR